MYLIVGTAELLALFLSAISIIYRTRSSPRELGLSLQTFGADCWLGLRAAALIIPLVYLLQTILALLWTPSKHPLFLALRDDPSLLLFASSVLVAVIAAPLFEEYAFRGLLQGWLERLSITGPFPQVLPESVPESESRESPPGGLTAARSLPGLDLNAPYRSPSAVGREAPSGSDLPAPRTLASWDESDNPWAEFGAASDLFPETADEVRPRFWPVAVSAAIFALMHLRAELDPDPIPLFVLALALGYLYQRTHSLVPGIIVHFLLNGCSMCILALELLYGNAGG